MILLLKLCQKAIIGIGLLLRLIARIKIPAMQSIERQLVWLGIMAIITLPPVFIIQHKIEKEERTRFIK